ncbi:MAG: hypothetical protein OWT28_03030 [Firmicutes bacterium]|nr:hypothetical protein [Bacillota bacterium]
MGGFWPKVPFYIPYSPGMPGWWDLVWWIFQIVVMSALLFALHKVGLREDREPHDDQPEVTGRAQTGSVSHRTKSRKM